MEFTSEDGASFPVVARSLVGAPGEDRLKKDAPSVDLLSF